MAAEPMPSVPFVKLESGGVILICGRDETAVEAGNLLKDHLDVTVLIEPPAAIAPPRNTDFPVAKGKVRNASGHLGAFEVTVDDFAQAAPSSRGTLTFGPSRNNARSTLRHHPRPDRRYRPFSGRRSARRLSARRSRQSRRHAAGGSQGARPRRHLREAALRHLRRHAVRPFPFAGSSAAPAASIFVRQSPLRPRATMSRSMRISAQAAANARPPVRPVRHPTRCRRKMR